MSSSKTSNPSHTIESILRQAEETTVTIGSHHGHFISLAQISALRKALSELDTWDSRPTPTESADEEPDEDVLRLERSVLGKEIKVLNGKIASASKASRPALNLELGQKLSRRAKLDKILKTFE